MFVDLIICSFISLIVCLCVCLFACLFVVCLFVCVCLSICLFVVCLITCSFNSLLIYLFVCLLVVYCLQVEMKNYWFVLKQDPTTAEFQYVLSWYQNERKAKLKGSLNLLPSMTLLAQTDRQFLLGYYFVVKTPDNEMYHFSGDSRSAVESWTSKIREAIMTGEI